MSKKRKKDKSVADDLNFPRSRKKATKHSKRGRRHSAKQFTKEYSDQIEYFDDFEKF